MLSKDDQVLDIYDAVTPGLGPVNKAMALEWCQKYKDAEAALIATPDEQLTYLQRSYKEGAKDPSKMVSVDPSVPTVPPPMREVIEELEQRLLE